MLFRCVVCHKSAGWVPCALCDLCHRHLIPAPEPCLICGDPLCLEPSQCQKPWRRAERPLSNLYAAYLLTDPALEILKRWKTCGGYHMDSAVYPHNGKSPLIPRLRGLGISAVIPVPQKRARSWRLGRSPARAFALWVARQLRLPLYEPPLDWVKAQTEQPQAALSLFERSTRVRRLRLKKTIHLKGTVLLVDDFKTSGGTLRETAQALHEGCPDSLSIHACVLGIRPRAQHRENPTLG